MMGSATYVTPFGGCILGKMIPLGAAFLVAAPAMAEVISCEMSDGDTLEFTIDHNQFVDAVDPNEPPRRKVTHVSYGARSFPAEPIVIGPTRGFHADGLGGTTMMFIMQPGGAATLTNRELGLRVEGLCEVKN
jgi:hypothetical protein